MADIFDVAEYILLKRGRISVMKLQKLCCYSQKILRLGETDRSVKRCTS